jgi:hypothetical protein
MHQRFASLLCGCLIVYAGGITQKAKADLVVKMGTVLYSLDVMVDRLA